MVQGWMSCLNWTVSSRKSLGAPAGECGEVHLELSNFGSQHGLNVSESHQPWPKVVFNCVDMNSGEGWTGSCSGTWRNWQQHSQQHVPCWRDFNSRSPSQQLVFDFASAALPEVSQKHQIPCSGTFSGGNGNYTWKYHGTYHIQSPFIVGFSLHFVQGFPDFPWQWWHRRVTLHRTLFSDRYFDQDLEELQSLPPGTSDHIWPPGKTRCAAESPQILDDENDEYSATIET